MHYDRYEAGEWVQPTPRGYRLACCDCGLVHRMDFRVVQSADGRRPAVQVRFFRHARATAAIRAARRRQQAMPPKAKAIRSHGEGHGPSVTGPKRRSR